MKTATSVQYPIVTALSQALFFLKQEDKLKNMPKWVPSTDRQKAFMNGVYKKTKAEAMELPDVKSMASRQASALNDWLKENGFNISLDPFSDPRDFGVASILNVLVNWLNPGEKSFIYKDDERFTSASLFEGFKVHESKDLNNPIAEISTVTGDKMFLTVADKQLEGEELSARLHELEQSLKPANVNFSELEFPMIDLDDQPDVSWLIGMELECDLGPGSIAQANQQTKFRMNERGARAESAFVMGVATCVAMSKPRLVLDQPFYAWISRDELSMPLFAGLLAKDCWKEPASL